MLFYVNVEPRQLYKFTKIAGRTIVTLVNIRREIERRPIAFILKDQPHLLIIYAQFTGASEKFEGHEGRHNFTARSHVRAYCYENVASLSVRPSSTLVDWIVITYIEITQK